MLNNTDAYQNQTIHLDLYNGLVDIDQIRDTATPLTHVKILHINSVMKGGGVAAILSHIVPLFKDIGIVNHWWVPEISENGFFMVTKRQHNMLQGIDNGRLSKNEQSLYWEIQRKVAEELARQIDNYDIIVLHDTQYLGMMRYLHNKRAKILYRCHIDTSSPNPSIYNFFMQVIQRCDATIYHLPQFALKKSPHPFFLLPSIDPFDPKNDMNAVSDTFIRDTIVSLGLDPLRPILLQVGRFDPAKGFEMVCDVFKRLKPDFPDLQLLLTGAGAKDDPEYYTYIDIVGEKVKGMQDVVIQELPFDLLKLNAVQQAGTIVYALSKKEGFGLVVSEASIKKRSVIVTDVGGLPRQVLQGKTGFVVESADEAVEKSRFLLHDPETRKIIGEAGRQYILSKFITPIHVRNYIEIFSKVLSI